MAPSEFVDLCKQLRALGACKVSAEGMEAVFVPQAQPTVTPKEKPTKRPKTPEQLQEEQYARELA